MHGQEALSLAEAGHLHLDAGVGPHPGLHLPVGAGARARVCYGQVAVSCWAVFSTEGVRFVPPVWPMREMHAPGLGSSTGSSGMLAAGGDVRPACDAQGSGVGGHGWGGCGELVFCVDGVWAWAEEEVLELGAGGMYSTSLNRTDVHMGLWCPYFTMSGNIWNQIH